MANFKVKLEVIKLKEHFSLNIIYYGKYTKEQPFRFFNSYKSIERVDLKIVNRKGEIIEPDGQGAISPKNTNEINTMISQTKPFVYNSIAELEEIDGKTVFLNFITSAYILKKGEPYYFYLHYLDEVTDKIEVIF